MSGKDFDQIFFLFAGLFGYYSLYRLQGMRLYSLDALFSIKAKKKAVVLRFFLGLAANLIVAGSLTVAYLYYRAVVNIDSKYGSLQTIVVISLVISTSSLVLITHRLIAAWAIKCRNAFFEDDWVLQDQLFRDTFGKFLDSGETAGAHFGGGILFLLSQSVVAGLAAGIIHYDHIVTHLKSLGEFAFSK